MRKGAVSSQRGTESIHHEEKSVGQELECPESRSSRGKAAAFFLLLCIWLSLHSSFREELSLVHLWWESIVGAKDTVQTDMQILRHSAHFRAVCLEADREIHTQENKPLDVSALKKVSPGVSEKQGPGGHDRKRRDLAHKSQGYIQRDLTLNANCQEGYSL